MVQREFFVGTTIIGLHNHNHDIVYLKRESFDFHLKSGYSGSELEFKNANTYWQPEHWTFLGISIGYTGDYKNYTIWGYVYNEHTKYEEGGWIANINITGAQPKLVSGDLLTYKVGPMINGYVKEVYTTDYLQDVESFKQFKDTFGVKRYNWFKGDTNQYPFYIYPGCGNGYELPNDGVEECDDGNNIDGDGCSSTWTVEDLYKWEKDSGVALSFGWEFTWQNGKVFNMNK